MITMKNFSSIFFMLCIPNMLMAQNCDTLDSQWITPTPTVITYSFGAGWITGVPDPANSILPTDSKGVFESYTAPNPGIEAVSSVRVGLGNLIDANDDMRFDIVVYDDDGAGAPGVAVGSETNISPTALAVPGVGFFGEYWIDITSNPIPTTATFHVGVIINAGSSADTLIVMTSCLGPADCPVAQGEGDASNHIFTSGFGYENLQNVYGADLDIDIVPKMGIPEDPSFTYSSNTYCDNDSDPTPTITGEAGGTFSSTPTGLDIDPSTGEVTIATSTNNTYTITYTTDGMPAGQCADSADWLFTIAPSYDQTATATVCPGDDFTFPDGSIQSDITSQVIQTSNLTTTNGFCDSIIVTTISVIPFSFVK